MMLWKKLLMEAESKLRKKPRSCWAINEFNFNANDMFEWIFYKFKLLTFLRIRTLFKHEIIHFALQCKFRIVENIICIISKVAYNYVLIRNQYNTLRYIFGGTCRFFRYTFAANSFKEYPNWINCRTIKHCLTCVLFIFLISKYMQL